MGIAFPLLFTFSKKSSKLDLKSKKKNQIIERVNHFRVARKMGGSECEFELGRLFHFTVWWH